ncbi:MAG TPA: hypothetical protein VFG46_07655 [Chryseolinea sp.]|nr:hypothetical protein [Chryseolinea sp.]
MNTKLISKSRWAITIICSLTMVFHNACDEGELSTPKGNVTFAVANLQNNSKAGRSLETLTPAFLLVDIDDENGNKLFVNQIMSLHAFGETYITENLELNKGNYILSKFLVLDTTHTVIYATPLNGSDRSQYIDNPLPTYFSIAENTETQVVPQVLIVSTNDTPGRFGYVSFDFEVVGIPPDTNRLDLPVKLFYAQNDGSYESYDSVYITFNHMNSVLVMKQRLTVDPITHSATGIIKNLPPGDWQISIDYFETITTDQQSEIERATTSLNITSSATSFLSDGITASVNNGDGASIEKLLKHDQYYVFYLANGDAMNAIVTLPVDPLDPFFEISFLNSAWSYFYGDRTFYETRSNEPGSHYVQGSAAFEKYNADNQAIDYVDTTAFKSLTDTLRNKNWTMADGLVIFYIDEKEQPIFYYQWNNDASTDGRKAHDVAAYDQRKIHKIRPGGVIRKLSTYKK